MEVKNCPNYLIFRNGAVLSKGSKFNKPKFLKHSLTEHGYYCVNLKDKNGYSKPRFIHRLIAEHYIPNTEPETKKFIDHKNRVRTDNRICNLRWVTQKENNNNMSERRLQKNNSTGYKFISITKDKYGNIGYRVSFQRKDLNIKKRFKNLDDAIKFRNEMIEKNNINCSF